MSTGRPFKGSFSASRLGWVAASLVLPAAILLASSLLLNVGEEHPTGDEQSYGQTPDSLSVRQQKILAVPYLSQGKTDWCFQTALAMVLQYWGKDVQPSDIASAQNREPTQSTSLLDSASGWARSYVSRWPDLRLQQDIVRTWSFEDYRSRIDGDEPVIVSNFGFPGHTVVVVGYSVEDGQHYLYLHDPSGYLTDFKWGLHELAFARVGWGAFAAPFSVPVLVHHAVVVHS